MGGFENVGQDGQRRFFSNLIRGQTDSSTSSSLDQMANEAQQHFDALVTNLRALLANRIIDTMVDVPVSNRQHRQLQRTVLQQTLSGQSLTILVNSVLNDAHLNLYFDMPDPPAIS